MVSFALFKVSLIALRKKVEVFKDDHKMASQAISVAIDSLPDPLGKFLGIVWNGLQKENEADSTKKMLAIMEKFENTNEEGFKAITSKLNQLINLMPSEEDIHNLGEKIRISNESITNLISDNTERIVFEIPQAQTRTVDDLKKYIGREDSLQVSYVQLHVRVGKVEQILTDIADYMNVQLKEYNDDIPFVPFENFENCQQSMNVFLKAPSGYGKSRTFDHRIECKY